MNFQGLVGACHQEGRGDVLFGWGRYLQHQWEAREALAQWNGEVGECVDWKVSAHGRGGDRGTPVQWEVFRAGDSQ